MGITDYNKKKQLNVDSVSGKPTVDKAQPLILSGGPKFDLSKASFTDTFSVSSQDGQPHDLAFSDTGKKMFVIGRSTSKVYEYSLSTAFDVSTASFNDSFDVSNQDSKFFGLAFSDTGNKMFVVGGGNDNVYEYSLSTGFDISTASFNDSFDVSSQDTMPRGIAFSNSGNFMYIIGTSSDTVYEYFLSTTFDVSTASVTDSFDVSSEDDLPEGLAFSDTGDKLFVVGTDTDNIYEYSLSPDFDLTTASLTDSFDVSSQEATPNGIAFSDAGNKLFVTGSTSDSVVEYSVGTDDSKTGNGDIVIDFTNVSDAQDIAVYDQNGNLLDYEIESLDTANETGVIWAYNDWVRDGTTQAQIAYGSNSANTDRQNVTATWGNAGQNARLIQHLNESNYPTDDALDSSSNNLDGTATGATSTSTEIDGGASFDGMDDTISINDGTGSKSLTIITYAKNNNVSISANERTFREVTNSGNSFGPVLGIKSGSIFCNSQDQNLIQAGVVNSNEYHHLSSRYDESNNLIEALIDASVVGSDSNSLQRTDGKEIRISGSDNFNVSWNGVISDVRVFVEAKSDAWLQADYSATPKAGQVFFSQQSVESTTTAVSATVTDSLGFNENTASTLSFTASDNLQVTESTAGTLSDTLSDNVQFSEQVLGTVQDDLTDQLGFTEKTATALASQVSDQLGFTEQTISNLTLQVLTSDNIQFTEQTEAQLLDTVTDQLSFQSTTQSAIAQSTSDQVTYSEAVSSALIDTLTDQVDFTEGTRVQGTALLTLTDQVAFAENTESALQDLESDQLGFNENVESRLEQVLEDGLGFSEQFEAELADTLSDSLDFSDRVAETVAATLTDSLSFAEKITASELLDLEIRSPTKAVMTTPDRFAVMESVTFKQNDLGDTLKATLKDDNGDINVSNASDVRLIANDRDGKNVLNESVTVTNGSAGEVEYSWSSGDFIEDAGIYRIEFEIEDGTGEVETVPNDGFVTVEIEEELTE